MSWWNLLVSRDATSRIHFLQHEKCAHTVFALHILVLCYPMVMILVKRHGRPTINDSWPDPIKEVLESSFDPDPANRPSIQLHYNVIRFHLLNLRDGDASQLGDTFIKRRRSFESMRKLLEETHIEEYSGGGGGGGEGQKSRATVAAYGSESAPQKVKPRRRMKMREKFEKFRLSIKQEE